MALTTLFRWEKGGGAIYLLMTGEALLTISVRKRHFFQEIFCFSAILTQAVTSFSFFFWGVMGGAISVSSTAKHLLRRLLTSLKMIFQIFSQCTNR